MESTNLKDYVFFKLVSNYGQIHIPTEMRKKLEIAGEEIYAMIILIPVTTKKMSMNKDEAYEFLKHIVDKYFSESNSQS